IIGEAVRSEDRSRRRKGHQKPILPRGSESRPKTPICRLIRANIYSTSERLPRKSADSPPGGRSTTTLPMISFGRQWKGSSRLLGKRWVVCFALTVPLQSGSANTQEL